MVQQTDEDEFYRSYFGRLDLMETFVEFPMLGNPPHCTEDVFDFVPEGLRWSIVVTRKPLLYLLC